jgi:hypothetical protein
MSPHGGVHTSLPDGLEMGIIVPVPGIGTAISGTDINATFIWAVNGINVTVHNFTADADPSTVTDPGNPDTDAYRNAPNYIPGTPP